MKKKILISIFAVIVVLSVCLAACSDNKQIEKISVDINSVKTVYTVGDTPDFSGIKVNATYTDGTTEELGFDDVTISGADTSTAGEKTVTVKYEDLTATFKITVNDPAVTVTAIKIIIPQGVDTTVLKGSQFDSTKLQIEATFSDGSTKALSLADVTISAIDTSSVGEKTLTVTYGSLSDSITVTVVDIASMQVVGGTLANKLYVGDNLDVSGVQLQVTYSGGKTEIIDAGFVVSALDTTTYGDKKVTVTYKGFSIKYPVQVVGPTGIEIVPGTVASKVTVFGSLDVSGAEAKLVLSDGTKREIPKADLTVTNIDTSVAGVKSLKAAYNGFETTMDVTVVGVKSIAVSGGTIKNEILKGETLNTSGAVLNVVFTDDTTATIQASAVTFGAFDGTEGGDKKLTITYLDKTVEYNVKVCVASKLVVEGLNKSFPAGEDIDLSGMKVSVEYNDTAKTKFDVTADVTTNVGSLDKDQEGDKTLVITYNGTYGQLETSVTLSASAPLLESIEISGDFVKYVITGKQNEYNDYLNKMVITAHYGNGTSEDITGKATVTKEILADKIVLNVSYTDTESNTSATASANVAILPVTSITVESGFVSKVNKGETLETSGMAFTVIYSNADHSVTETIYANNSELTISAPDTTTGGNKYLDVTFRGYTAKVHYHVVAVSKINYNGGLVDSVRFGYDVDVSGLKVILKYTDDTEMEASAASLGVTVNKPDTKFFTLDPTMGTPVVPDTCSVTFTYEGVTFEHEIPVIAISYITALNGTVPGSIFAGETTLMDKFSNGSMKLSIVYEDGQVYLENMNNSALIKANFNIDVTTGGEKGIVIEYMPLGGNKYFSQTSVNVFVYAIDRIEIVKDSILTTVPKGSNFSTDGLQIKVYYSVEGVYSYVDTTDDLLEIIGTVDTETVGTHTITVKYRGVTKDVVITVKESSSLTGGTVYGAMLPDNLVARNSYIPNFKIQDHPYIVGDDNPFKFYLNVIVLDDDLNIQDVPGDKYEYAIKVYLGDSVENGTLLEGTERDKYVVIDPANNTYDFTDEAVGKSFVLAICPKKMDTTNDDNYKSLAVKVVNGYNVYSAKELNFITNYWDHDMDGGDVSGDNDQLTAVYNLMKKANLYTDRDVNGDGVADLYDYYLYVDSIRALVIHNNIDITPSDIPAEYTFTHTNAGAPKAEFLEQLGVYERRLTAANPTFDIYGNYFSIFSYKLPCVVPAGVANNPDEYSSTSLIKIKIDGSEQDLYPNGDFPFQNYKTTFTDLSMRDNDPNSNDQSASERHMRGIQAFKVGEHTCDIINVNVEAYAISLITEGDYTTLNLDHVKFYNAWQGHLFLWGGNAYQSEVDKEALPSFENNPGTKVYIKESLLAKCGGPVILAQHPDRKDACNNRSRIDVIADKNSEIYSYVTGQEAWFVAVGQTQTAAQILAMNQLLQLSAMKAGTSASYTSQGYIQGVNTVNMIMVNMGTGTTFGAADENYTGSFTRDGVKALDMTDPKSGLTCTNPVAQQIIDGTKALGAPVFQSNVGVGIESGANISQTNCVYSDGKSGVFFPNLADPKNGIVPPAGSDIYSGDYITLYYQGMGIMMEYYNSTNPG